MKKIKLKSTALTDALIEITGAEKVGWSGHDHDRLIEVLLRRIEDEEGKQVPLSPLLLERIRGIVRPVLSRQLAALTEVLATAGFELDQTTRTVFALLSDMAVFSTYLAEEKNPRSKKPYIQKESRRKKREMFSTLFVDETLETVTREGGPSVKTVDVAPVSESPKPPEGAKAVEVSLQAPESEEKAQAIGAKPGEPEAGGELPEPVEAKATV